MSTNAVASKQPTSGSRLLLQISGVLAAIGIICWLVQLIMGPNALADTVPFGIYIAAFFLLAGTGSGLIILVAAGEFAIVSGLKDLRRSLLIGSVACYIAAGFMILMDLGQPLRVLNFLISPNFSSMFVWDFYFLVLTVILALVCLFRPAKGKALISLTALAALGVIVIEGWILSVNPGTIWHSSLIPAMFIAEALIVAVAVVLTVKGEGQKVLERVLMTLLAVTLIFTLLEAVTGNYMDATNEGAGIKLLLSGSLAPFYWSQIILGIVAPFLLLIWKGKTAATIKLAAVLAILGVLLAKINLLVAGQALPFEADQVGYFPSIVEIGGFLGGLGLAVLLFILGKTYLGKGKESTQ